MKTRAFGRILYPADWFEHITFRRPVCSIHRDGKWNDMNVKWKEHERKMKRTLKGKSKWEEQEGKWIQREIQTKGTLHESKMKGTWKETNTFVDFRPRMLSHPQKAGKITFQVQRATAWPNNKSKNNDNMILGHSKREGACWERQKISFFCKYNINIIQIWTDCTFKHILPTQLCTTDCQQTRRSGVY